MSNSTSLDEPALPAPAGQTSDLVNPPSQSYLIIITVAICLSTSSVMVWIRLYVSSFIMKKFRWDDGLILFSWLMFIAYSIVLIEAIPHGALTNIWDITAGNAMQLNRLGWIQQLIYAFLIFQVKLAVLVLYKRIFVPRGNRTWVWWSIMAVIIFNALFYTADLFVEAFNCIPTDKIWDPEVPGHCVDVYSVIIATAALNVVSDIFVVLVPLSVVWNLRLPRKRKVELTFVFAFSILCLIFSIGRLVQSIVSAKNPNQSVALVKIGLWTFGEITSCFVTCCVPMVPPLYKRLKRSFGKSDGYPKMRSFTLGMHKSSRSSDQDTIPPFRSSSAASSLRMAWTRKFVNKFRDGSQEDDPYLITRDQSPENMHNDKEGHDSGSNGSNEITVSRSYDLSTVSRDSVPPFLRT